MVGAHFSSVEDALFPHTFLDEGMAALAADRLSVIPGNDFFRIPGQPGIIEDLAARMFLEEILGK